MSALGETIRPEPDVTVPGIDRVHLLLVAVAVAMSGFGSWLGVGPTWPDPKVWAALAWVAALLILVQAFFPTATGLRTMTTIILGVAALRITGFAFFPASAASRWGGMGGWLLILVLAVRCHVAERRHTRWK